MGILYNSVTAASISKFKKEHLLEKLREQGIFTSREGEPIEGLTYKELKWELVFASFRD